MHLSPVTTKFILHWGEMGTRWGINRTVAQVHALLYTSPKPLNAEEIAETLSVARSNVSTSLRELQGWGIVKTVHVLGDRRDHFEAISEVWEMFRVILRERKSREIDPVMLMLRESVADRWITHVDILRNDEPVLSVPMSPYVEKNMDRVAAAAVARIAAMLMQAEADTSADTHLGPAGNQPGGERK